MGEKPLRNIFFVGTLLFLLILLGMTVDSLTQVANTRTPQVTDQVVAGKKVWQGRNCNDCHTVLGIGGYFAPELTKVIDRRGAAWVSAFLTDPKAVIPAATMPNQQLTPTQVADVTAFLTWVRGIDTNGWPPQPKTAALTTAANGGTVSGKVLFQQKGCIGCHMINGEGTAGIGPDLSRIGSQAYDALPNTPEFLNLWIENPQAQKAGTIMPPTAMTPAERDALVQYLVSLK